MAQSSKAYIESVSRHCYAQMTYYEFNKTTLSVSEKYRKGRLAALKYVGELTWHYLSREEKLQEAFKAQLIEQMKQHACLRDGDYKQGLFDALNEMLNID